MDGTSHPAAPHPESPCVLMPAFNDWEALDRLLPRLDAELAASSRTVRVFLLDDGSTASRRDGFASGPFQAIEQVHIVHLRRNLGHQRALAIGLAYVDANVQTPAVLIMDADGEDAPSDVPRLLHQYEREHGGRIVFAERRRRSESMVFRCFYALYRLAHWIMTGRKVRVGNFSIVPSRLLSRLVVVSELWNHYAAAVFKSRLPFGMIPTSRAQRLDGQSRMNYVALVTHGLSAISVYSEEIGVRALVASLGLIGVSAAGIAAIIAIRSLTELAIPGWATVSTGILLIVLLQAVMLSLVFSFTILAGRQGPVFIPSRDYAYFVAGVTDVYPSPR